MITKDYQKLKEIAKTMENPKRCGGLDYFYCAGCEKTSPQVRHGFDFECTICKTKSMYIIREK